MKLLPIRPSLLIVLLGVIAILAAACVTDNVESVPVLNRDSGREVVFALPDAGPQDHTAPTAQEIQSAPAFEPTDPLPIPRQPLSVPRQGLGFEFLTTPPRPEPNQPLSVLPPTQIGRALVVDQSLQMLGVFEDGVEVQRFAISSGRPTYTSYTLGWNGYVGNYVGTFQSYTGGKADNAWFLYQASGAILIHSLPYHEVDGEKQYYDADALGNYPASAGCIRVAPDNMQWLTDQGLLNVPITITEYPGPIEGLLLFNG